MKFIDYKALCKNKLPGLIFNSYTQSPFDDDHFLGFIDRQIAELWIDLDGEGGIFMHFFEFAPKDKQEFANEIYNKVKDNITTVEFEDIIFDVFDNCLEIMIVPSLNEKKDVKDKICYWRLHDGEWDDFFNTPLEDSREFKLKMPMRKYCKPTLGFELSLYGVMYVVDNFYTEPDEKGVYDVWIVKK